MVWFTTIFVSLFSGLVGLLLAGFIANAAYLGMRFRAARVRRATSSFLLRLVVV